MAILGKTGISTYLVGSALETNSRDVGSLCTHSNINVWSKWKPIESNVTIMTLDELRHNNYGITMLSANNIQELVRKINSSLGIGYSYKRAKTKFRLGDFRNYDTKAPLPCSKTYRDDEEIQIGGVTANNHSVFEKICGSIEVNSTDTTLGVNDIYNYIDEFGNTIKLRRGCYITDGTKSAWYTDRFYWWTNEMQYFGGKTVTIYEFYTNVIKGADGIIRHPGSDSTSPWDTDRYFALPYPRYTKEIKKDTMIGSKLVFTDLSARFLSTIDEPLPYSSISFGVVFDATGAAYRGGTLYDVTVRLSRDSDGNDVIGRAIPLADKLTVSNGTKSKRYTGILKNELVNVNGEMVYPSNVWVSVWFNAKNQAQRIPIREAH